MAARTYSAEEVVPERISPSTAENKVWTHAKQRIMGSEQSQARGRVVCQGGVFVSDGQSIKQVVDVQRDATYTHHDASSMAVMMNRDVQSAISQFDTALSCVEGLSGTKAIVHKK